MLYLSAQSFASCTPTFRRPPRSHLLPTSSFTVLSPLYLSSSCSHPPIFKAFPVGDIVDKHHPLGTPVIGCSDVPEPLLASSVP